MTARVPGSGRAVVAAGVDRGAASGERADLLARARASALLITLLAVAVVPAWSGFDVLLEPGRAAVFTVVRLAWACLTAPLAWVLWRHPLGRRRPELCVFLVLAGVQAVIAWMLPRVTHVELYLLGFSLAVYASGCILFARPRWTWLLIGTSWTALAIAVLTSPATIAPHAVLAMAFYLGTASIIALAAHHQRYRLAMGEFHTRTSLEREQLHAHELLEQLERLSNEDSLTGVANRRRWDAELAAACAGASAGGGSVAVVLADVDRFKQINDRFGHARGDHALRLVSELLRDRVRDGDLVARLGGDELAVLLPGADLARARELAEEVRRGAVRLEAPGLAPGILTLSLGVAVAAGEQADPELLMTAADGQLYLAKATRNSVSAPAQA